MNKLEIIKNGYIQNPGCEKIRADIAVQNSKITEIFEDLSGVRSGSAVCIDAKGMTITPGFIDIHIHGGYGINFNTASSKEILELTKKLPEHGITSLVATIMTDTEENIKRQIEEISDAMKKQEENSAKILGIHLEGPFLNPKFKGIHSDESILPPTVENFKKFENENIKIVTYAPELDENFDLTRYLAEKNIIASAGHTSASLEEFNNACRAGLKSATHLFNAMSPLHHRNPAIIGGILTNDSIFSEIISDREHLHPAIIDLALRVKPKDKIIFISDSLPLNRSPKDSIIFGGQEIFIKEGRAVNKDGTFAGSLSFLDDNLRKNIDMINVSDFLNFSSLNPAKLLGLNTKGFIKKGFDADLIFWNENFEVVKIK